MKWICIKETALAGAFYKVGDIVEDGEIYFVRSSFRIPITINIFDDPEIDEANKTAMTYNSGLPQTFINAYEFQNNECFISLAEHRENQIDDILND